MVEPFLLPSHGNSTSAQSPYSWQNEHTYTKTERNDTINHQLDDSDDDDVLFVCETPGPSRPTDVVDLSKSIFELLNGEFADDVHVNGNSTTTIASENNAGHSLSNHTRHTITSGQLELDTNITLTNPFSQTLPQITVANFAKENVLDNSNGANGSNSIFHDLDWLKDENNLKQFSGNGATEQLPKTTLAAAATATSTITANDWDWANPCGVMKFTNETLPGTYNLQPSTSNFDWHLPHADVTNCNATPAQIAANNEPILNNFGRPAPLPLAAQQNLPGPNTTATSNTTGLDWNWGNVFGEMKLPNQTQAATNNPQPSTFNFDLAQPGPSTSNFDLHLDVTNLNAAPSQIATNSKPKMNHQIHNNFAPPAPLPFVPQQNQPGPSRLAYQSTQQIVIPQHVPPPLQQPNLPTPLPFVPQHNQPGPSRLAYQPRQQIGILQHLPPPPQLAKRPTQLPYVPQQNQPGPSWRAQQIDIPQHIPRPPQVANLPKPFVPQHNQPGPSQLDRELKQKILEQNITDATSNIVYLNKQANDPANGMHPPQWEDHTLNSGNVKRKHTDVIPIKVVRATKQYDTLIEMGFLQKDVETALRKFKLDLYETIEYLSEPKHAAKRRKNDAATHYELNAVIPNQIQQSHEEPKENAEPIRKPANLYEELLYLEETGGAVKSIESFDCEICMETIEMKDGMILRNCLHRYCKDCLNGTIVHSDEIEIKCPYVSCEETLQDREIRAVLSQEEYEKYLMKCVRVAQVTISGTILCNLPDCDGWCICEDVINNFKCPQCKNINCIPCKAIHPGRNCREYQDDLAAGDASGIASGQRRSEQAIQELIDNNEAMKCFKCGILIMKRDGCDYIQCVMCKGDICWATRGPRYGPGGKGDYSGGCGCTLQKKCHKDCRGCHL